VKELLTKLCWPILSLFEKGDDNYRYKPMNRKILIVVGCLFTLLAVVIVFVAPHAGGSGFILPLLVFLSAGVVCLAVGTLGSDKAVSKIWGGR